MTLYVHNPVGWGVQEWLSERGVNINEPMVKSAIFNEAEKLRRQLTLPEIKQAFESGFLAKIVAEKKQHDVLVDSLTSGVHCDIVSEIKVYQDPSRLSGDSGNPAFCFIVEAVTKNGYRVRVRVFRIYPGRFHRVQKHEEQIAATAKFFEPMAGQEIRFCKMRCALYRVVDDFGTCEPNGHRTYLRAVPAHLSDRFRKATYQTIEKWWLDNR